MFGARDPHGLRPLAIGRLGEHGWVLASETAALDIVGAHYVREVEPGELVSIDERGLRSSRYTEAPRSALCLFEFVYLARADSRLYGRSVHEARREMGRSLARQAPAPRTWSSRSRTPGTPRRPGSPRSRASRSAKV